MKILKSSSSTYPPLIDDYSSPTSVFVHEDIQEITRTDEEGLPMTEYIFMQKIYTRDEWDKIQTAEAILDVYTQIAELKGIVK